MLLLGASRARPSSPLYYRILEDSNHVDTFLAWFVPSLFSWPAATSRNKSTPFNTLPPHGAKAGESPQAAAAIIKESEQNTQQLTQAIQSGKSDDIAAMSGKLVKLDGEVAQQSDSTWTIKNDAGWTIVASVNDLTPHSNLG